MGIEPAPADVPGTKRREASRIGLGIATLMREGSRSARERVFDAAYAAGVRHLDVAPLYGLGEAEKELGRLLRRTSGEFTIATKFGLQPSSAARVAAVVQGPIRKALASSNRLRSMARKYSGTAVPVRAPSKADVVESVHRSMRSLGVDYIDILLLHDLPWTTDLQGLWGELSSVDAVPEVGALGITGDSSVLEGYPRSVLTSVDVLQMPSNFGIVPPRRAGSLIIEYGVLSTSLIGLGRWLDDHEVNRQTLEDLIGQGLRTSYERAQFLAALALSRDDKSMLLVGTTKASHIQGICEGVERLLPALLDNKVEMCSLKIDDALGLSRLTNRESEE